MIWKFSIMFFSNFCSFLCDILLKDIDECAECFRLQMTMLMVWRHIEEKYVQIDASMEARRGKVKEDKFLVNFKRLLINGQQYFTNAEKFEIKSGNLREAKLFSSSTSLECKARKYHLSNTKKHTTFTCVCRLQ